ncbi:unnamed protein product [Meloidogyne enterolobii]|uniref:Uncharacterized protein n=1 Tax=Meloidogyne enterolobii TaxID=390850 RepID=A0ACB0XKR1_MELEN
MVTPTIAAVNSNELFSLIDNNNNEKINHGAAVKLISSEKARQHLYFVDDESQKDELNNVRKEIKLIKDLGMLTQNYFVWKRFRGFLSR